MKHKKAWSYLLALGVLVPLSLYDRVQSSDVPRLSDSQEVIVRANEELRREGAERLGNTEFYVAPMGVARELHEQGKATSIHPIQTYTSVMSANDTFEPQAYLNLLGASGLWDETTGTSSTVVAVIDSGFALSHEDLAGRWLLNTGESNALASNGLDDDGNGYTDDWRGWDFANDDNNPSAGTTDPLGGAVWHGTAVTGMIGATGNNNKGVASLNWAATIMPLQIFTDGGSATTAELAAALDYAIDNGADIINLSLGSAGSDPVIEALIDSAQAAGIVVVAAAGNCGDTDFADQGCSYQGQTLYPATNPKTIAVAATDLSDARASFSSYGDYVDVAAPGSGAIYTTLYDKDDPLGWYSGTMYGTSFSAPVVSGLSALLREAWPTANAYDIQAALKDTALKTGQMAGQKYTPQVGFGRIRPLNAVQRAQACASVSFDEDVNCDSSINLVDISTLVSQWQLLRGGRTDINQSGKTDLTDISLLIGKWGQ